MTNYSVSFTTKEDHELYAKGAKKGIKTRAQIRKWIHAVFCKAEGIEVEVRNE